MIIVVIREHRVGCLDRCWVKTWKMKVEKYTTNPHTHTHPLDRGSKNYQVLEAHSDRGVICATSPAAFCSLTPTSPWRPDRTPPRGEKAGGAIPGFAGMETTPSLKTYSSVEMFFKMSLGAAHGAELREIRSWRKRVSFDMSPLSQSRHVTP